MHPVSNTGQMCVFNLEKHLSKPSPIGEGGGLVLFSIINLSAMLDEWEHIKPLLNLERISSFGVERYGDYTGYVEQGWTRDCEGSLCCC